MNATPTLQDVAARSARATATRSDLEAQRADVESLIAVAMEAGEPTADLEQRHASILARLAALPSLERAIYDAREAALRDDTTAKYESLTRDLFDLYSQVAAVDCELTEHVQKVDALQRMRSELMSQARLVTNRRNKLLPLIRQFGLMHIVEALARQFSVPRYL